MIKTDTMTPQFFQDKLDPGAFLSNQGTFSVGAAELVRRERQEVGFGPPTLTPRVGLAGAPEVSVQGGQSPPGFQQ